MPTCDPCIYAISCYRYSKNREVCVAVVQRGHLLYGACAINDFFYLHKTNLFESADVPASFIREIALTK